jgi:AcrR family transcriptional regulator
MSAEPKDTETVIMNAVLECLRRDGLTSLTTRRIAKTAGVNEVTLFRRFGSKEALLKAAYARERERVHFDVRYTGNLAQDLTAVVDGYSRILAAHGDIVMVTMAEFARTTAADLQFDSPLKAFEAVSALLQQYQSNDSLCQEPAPQMATALLGPLLLRFALSRVRPSIQPFDSLAYVKLFLEGRSTRERA